MTAVVQFLAVTALGLVVSWALHQWVGLFDNKWMAFALWFAVLITYGYLYDRHTARRHRRMQDWQQRGQLPAPPRE